MLQKVNPTPADRPLERPLVIVHCVRSTIGGIFRHISDLIRHQAANGHHVGLICDSLTGGEFEAERLEELKPFLRLGAVRLPMPRSIGLKDYQAYKQVQGLLSMLDVDVVHAHGAKGGVYARFAVAQINRKRRKQGEKPVVAVYSPHGGSLHYSPVSPQGRVYFAIERFMERFTNEFLFVAGYEVEAYTRKIGKPRIPWTIAYNGLNQAEFVPVVPNSNAVDFMFAGHMRNLKGADLFIDAVEIANARSSKPINALMVGDGEDRPFYEAEVARRGLASLITFTDPMPIGEAFPMTKNLVVPSRAEAMPYIVLEALGARVPTIVTEVGGVPEVFGANAHHLIPPGDANLIATAMLDRLQRPKKARELAAKLRAHVQDRFTSKRMFEKIDAVYRRQLGTAVATGAKAKEAAAQGKLASAK